MVFGRVMLAAAAVVALGGCSAAVDGNGRAARTAGRSGSGSPPDFASSAVAASSEGGTDTAAPSSSPAKVIPVPAGRPATVTGSSSSRVYNVHIWAEDAITDCVAHAYGATMITFLRGHPCSGARRVLATIDLDGRTAVVSAIDTSIPGTATDPYANSARFQALERADGTGSINDLMREGKAVPGIARGIPRLEAFLVLGQDDGTSILDAWWFHGATRDQDPRLVSLEQDLFLSGLTSA